jgi:NAD-dependent oxidoreductase involved in siderophore biosynthesis
VLAPAELAARFGVRNLIERNEQPNRVHVAEVVVRVVKK